MAPMWVTGWGGGPMYKVTVHLLLEEMHGWILTKLGRNHPQGLGIQRCSYGTCGHHGGPGGGPQGPKLCKFQTSSPDPVKVEQ